MDHASSSDANPPTMERGAIARLYLVLGSTVALSIGFTSFFVITRHVALAAERVERAAEAERGPRVLVDTVELGPAHRTITLPGDVHPIRQATLYAKLPGYLRDIVVERGDTVKAGQVLGTITSPETDQQLQSARADRAVKQQTERRFLDLVDRGVVSRQEVDVARAQRLASEAEVSRLEATKNYEIIRAPYDGIITTRYVDAGALLPAAVGSTQSAQPLVDIQDATSVRIFVYVSQSEAVFVKAGDLAHIASHELKDFFVDAKVTRVAHALDTRTRTMLVELDVPNPGARLTPGLFVKVSLQLDVPQIPLLPAEAVFLRKGVPYVAVIDNNLVHYTQVRLGQSDGQFVQVLEGVSAGAHVGLHIGDDILDHVHVRPIEPNHPNIQGDQK